MISKSKSTKLNVSKNCFNETSVICLDGYMIKQFYF